MIAWYPAEMVAPPELTSVLVPKGELSQGQWIEALSDRVMWLVLKEENPLESANAACQKMNLPEVDNANQLGNALVKNNLNLRTNLNVTLINQQFPMKVSEESELAKEALKETSLEEWVELALSQVSVSSLD
jgi:hypothetical protein